MEANPQCRGCEDLKALLSVIWGLTGRHRRRLALTYGLTLIENCFRVFYPFAIGLTIDGLLKGQASSLIHILAVWLAHLAVGLFRHIYDTHAFTAVYNDLAVATVHRQRDASVKGETIVARVTLSRELVNFFQMDAPAVIGVVTAFGGALAMMFQYDLWVGLYAAIAVLPIALANGWFGNRSLRLNRGLNDRLEHEVAIVSTKPLAQIQRHFHRTRFWRIRISNAEAIAFGAIELCCLSVTALVLLRLSHIDGITAGTIYAVLAYVWEYYESINRVPALVQNVARIQDIAKRVAHQPVA